MENVGMKASRMVTLLRSTSLSDRLDASYKLESGDFADDQVLTAVRENLRSDDPDLLEITIMRLLLRGRDVHSVEPVLRLVETKDDDEGLIFSSGVRALSGLAANVPDIALNILSRLERVSRTNLDVENAALLEETILELREIAA